MRADQEAKQQVQEIRIEQLTQRLIALESDDSCSQEKPAAGIVAEPAVSDARVAQLIECR